MAKQAFFGFEPGEAEHRRKKVKSRPDAAAPAIHKLVDAVAVPGLTGLYDSGGRRIDEAAATTITRDGRPFNRDKLYSKTPELITLPTDLNVVDEPVIFGGFLSEHYGHFIIDTMSRLWARDMYPTLPILFTKPTTWSNYPSFGRDIFNALQLLGRVTLGEGPTLFRNVICPGTAFEYRWKAFTVADAPHTAVAEAMDGAARSTWRQPVYLTRSGLGERQRKIDAECELEEELSRRGVEVICPETLPLGEQISLFERAPVVIGTMGSALHTALFSRSSGRKLAILNWGRGFENCLLVDAVKAHTSYYVKSVKHRAEGAGYAVDVGLALWLLEEAGLLPTRAASVVTGSDGP
jgi:capsular polysaccharide biosynthesis protein